MPALCQHYRVFSWKTPLLARARLIAVLMARKEFHLREARGGVWRFSFGIPLQDVAWLAFLKSLRDIFLKCSSSPIMKCHHKLMDQGEDGSACLWAQSASIATFQLECIILFLSPAVPKLTAVSSHDIMDCRSKGDWRGEKKLLMPSPYLVVLQFNGLQPFSFP